jgi:hypothetical protein
MAQHQGNTPENSRDDHKNNPAEGGENPSESSLSSGDSFARELQAPAFLDARMLASVSALVSEIEEQGVDHFTKVIGSSFPPLKQLSEYMHSTPQDDMQEMQRRFFAASQEIIQEVGAKLGETDIAELAQNGLLTFLIRHTASAVCGSAISRDLKYAHDVFVASVIDPFLRSIAESENDIGSLRKDPLLSPGSFRQLAREQFSVQSRNARDALFTADKWNEGHLLAGMISINHALDFLEETILPPVEITPNLRKMLSSALSKQFQKGVEQAALVYHKNHQEVINGALRRLEDVLPPRPRLPPRRDFGGTKEGEQKSTHDG